MDQLETSVDARRRRRRRRGLVVLLLTFAVASLGAGVFSLALFTDTDASNGSFTAGTIDIATSPTTLFTVNPLMPGDSGSATLTVTNSGTAQLRYAMDSTSTNTDGLGLRSVLGMTISLGACPTSATVFFSGPLWTNATTHAKIGNIAPGDQGADRVLNAAGVELLCFAWDLPIGTGNAYQGATTTATFTFSAEQTANNP
jgi:predicted ribosomally synthesized peptide with SipW-like signal peptide